MLRGLTRKSAARSEAEPGSFSEFVERAGPRLRAGLVAAYGPHDGADAASTALEYGLVNWERLRTLDNPAGYLYRVGQTSARRQSRWRTAFPVPHAAELPDFEPRLVPALESLSELQRTCVVMIHGYG